MPNITLTSGGTASPSNLPAIQSPPPPRVGDFRTNGLDLEVWVGDKWLTVPPGTEKHFKGAFDMMSLKHMKPMAPPAAPAVPPTYKPMPWEENSAIDSEHYRMKLLAMAVDVSQADGEMEPAEIVALKKVAKILAVNPADFGVN